MCSAVNLHRVDTCDDWMIKQAQQTLINFQDLACGLNIHTEVLYEQTF